MKSNKRTVTNYSCDGTRSAQRQQQLRYAEARISVIMIDCRLNHNTSTVNFHSEKSKRIITELKL